MFHIFWYQISWVGVGSCHCLFQVIITDYFTQAVENYNKYQSLDPSRTEMQNLHLQNVKRDFYSIHCNSYLKGKFH